MTRATRALVRATAALSLLVACTVHAGKPDTQGSKEGRMLEEGLALLQKHDARSICEGAGKLARLGRPEAIEPLLGLLKTRDEAVRECVRDALAKLAVAPVLLAQWRSSDEAVKDRSLELAAALPHPDLMTMYGEAASDPSAMRRRRVAIGLRRQSATAVVWTLLGTLVADADRDVRWWAIDTLGLFKGRPEATAILRQRQGAEADENLRKFIARALGEAE